MKRKKQEDVVTYDKDGNLVEPPSPAEQPTKYPEPEYLTPIPQPPQPQPINCEDVDDLLETMWTVTKKLFNREYEEEIKEAYGDGFKDGRRKH